MGRKKVEGFCGICGKFGPLTYEHVPPRAAFNEGKFIVVPNEIIHNVGSKKIPKGPIFQGGIGFHALCGKCNNLTGHRYGADFVQFAYQAISILQRAKFKPTLIYPYHICPLRVIKQIITMFLAVNHSNPFRKVYPELVKFVMNRDEKYLDPKYQLYIYYNHEGNTRYLGFSVIGDFEKNIKPIQMTEIAYPPFGFVLTLNDAPMIEDKLFNISFFSRYGYNEWTDVNLRLSVLPTHLQVPLDYREESEIDKAISESDNIDLENKSVSDL